VSKFVEDTQIAYKTSSSYQDKTPLDYQYAPKKMKDRREKIGLFQGWVHEEVGRHKKGEMVDVFCVQI
jgi:hypothetical protein